MGVSEILILSVIFFHIEQYFAGCFNENINIFIPKKKKNISTENKVYGFPMSNLR